MEDDSKIHQTFYRQKLPDLDSSVHEINPINIFSIKAASNNTSRLSTKRNSEQTKKKFIWPMAERHLKFTYGFHRGTSRLDRLIRMKKKLIEINEGDKGRRLFKFWNHKCVSKNCPYMKTYHEDK